MVLLIIIIGVIIINMIYIVFEIQKKCCIKKGMRCMMIKILQVFTFLYIKILDHMYFHSFMYMIYKNEKFFGKMGIIFFSYFLIFFG